MTAEVLHLVHVAIQGDTADELLTAAMGKCEVVAVLGYAPDGTLYVQSTECIGETLLLMERAKMAIIE